MLLLLLITKTKEMPQPGMQVGQPKRPGTLSIVERTYQPSARMPQC
jgi:hypothetical protein